MGRDNCARKASSPLTKRERERRRRERIARQKRYNLTPKGRYRQHKANAKRRGVEFLLTFSEWFELWEPYLDESGHLPDEHDYVMARNGDEGPYKVGNVRIAPQGENIAERNRWYFASRRWRRSDEGEDYQHVHSAPGVDSARGEPGPDVPF